jgi:hypothetical protein
MAKNDALYSLVHYFAEILLLFVLLLIIAPASAFPFSDDLSGDLALQSPAVITDRSRNPLTDDDFLRLIYVTRNQPVTTLGKPSLKRAFFGNTTFYSPPIAPSQIANYAGGLTNPNGDMVAMRCRPNDVDAVDPELAIWPNVAGFLQHDLTAVSCPVASNAPTAQQAYCLAANFQDTPNNPLILSLYNAISLGKNLFTINDGDGGNLLYDLYGIGSGHSGLGFVVKGSANVSFTAAQTLENSVVPEYLLINVSLADATCKCVQVPPYAGRDDTPLSPAFISSFGSLTRGGACHSVPRILPF